MQIEGGEYIQIFANNIHDVAASVLFDDSWSTSVTVAAVGQSGLSTFYTYSGRYPVNGLI